MLDSLVRVSRRVGKRPEESLQTGTEKILRTPFLYRRTSRFENEPLTYRHPKMEYARTSLRLLRRLTRELDDNSNVKRVATSDSSDQRKIKLTDAINLADRS